MFILASEEGNLAARAFEQEDLEGSRVVFRIIGLMLCDDSPVDDGLALMAVN